MSEQNVTLTIVGGHNQRVVLAQRDVNAERELDALCLQIVQGFKRAQRQARKRGERVDQHVVTIQREAPKGLVSAGLGSSIDPLKRFGRSLMAGAEALMGEMLGRVGKKLAMAGLAIAVGSASAYAATFTVTTTSDTPIGGFLTLREAIGLANAAPDADVIEFSPTVQGNTISLGSSDDTTFGDSAFLIKTPITIDGGTNGVTLNANNARRHFLVHNFSVTGDDDNTLLGSLTIKRMTLAGGRGTGFSGGHTIGDGGGGGGSAGLGGSILAFGTLTVDSCLFTNNTVSGGAGGNGSNLSNWYGAGGGAGLGGVGGTQPAYATGGDGGPPNGGTGGYYSPSTSGGFGGGGGGGNQTNDAGDGGFGAGGGGATWGSGKSPTNGNGGYGAGAGGAYGGTVRGAPGDGGFGGGGGGGEYSGGGGGAGMGGAIFGYFSSISISNSTFSSNSAAGGGGGSPSPSQGTAGAAGLGIGGAIAVVNGTANIRNNTVSGNSATRAGGVFVMANNGPLNLTIANNAITGNTATDDFRSAASGGTITSTLLTNNMITLSSTTLTLANPVTGNADLGALATNGGPTQSMKPGATSDLIDAGSNAAAAGLATDQRGNPRIAVGTVEIGAVELIENAAPVLTIPGTIDIARNSSVTLNGGNLVSFTDADAGTADVRLTLTSTQFRFTLTNAPGINVTSGSITNSLSVTVEGTVAELNAALDGMVVTPPAGLLPGAFSINISVNDLGNTGETAANTVNDTIDFNLILGPNIAPVVTLPAGPQVEANRNNPFVLNSANNTLISIDDADAEPNAIEVTLTATSGTLTLASTTGLTFAGGETGTGETLMTFTGTLPNIATALDGMIFNPTDGYDGAASIRVQVDDQGNLGTGGALTDDKTLNFQVVLLPNQAPVITLPAGPLSIVRGTSILLSGAGAITLADPDEEGGVFLCTIDVVGGAATGTVTLNGATAGNPPAGVTITGGNDGFEDASLSFTGTLAAIQAVVTGMRFNGNFSYVGQPALIDIMLDDQGDFGLPPAQQDTKQLSIDVTFAPNNAPTVTVPTAYQVTLSNVAIVYSAATGNAITVSDPDANGDVELRLTATNGVITLATTAGLTFTTGDGTEDNAITVQGTLAELNAALDGCSWKGNPGYLSAPGNFGVFNVTLDDLANTSQPPALTDMKSLSIEVAQTLNDPPAIGLPLSIVVFRNKNYVFSSANGNAISVSDPDAQSLAIECTISATNGRLTLANDQIVTVTSAGGASNATSITFSGSQANINTALNGMFYRPNNNYEGAASITVMVNDKANVGGGGELTATRTLNFNVEVQFNVAPTVNVPTPPSSVSYEVIRFASDNGHRISVADVDHEGGQLEVTLTATSGDLTLGSMTGITVVSDTKDATAMTHTIVIRGTLAQLNSAIDGLLFAPLQGIVDNSHKIDVLVDDLGNTGSPGALTGTGTVNMNIEFTLNQAPVIFAPNVVQYVGRSGAMTFSIQAGNGIQVSDVDAGDAELDVLIKVMKYNPNDPNNPVDYDPEDRIRGSLTLSIFSTIDDFRIGNGRTDSEMQFRGTLQEINRALDRMVYTPNSANPGREFVRVRVDDLGNSGDDTLVTSNTATRNILVESQPETVQTVVTGPDCSLRAGGSSSPSWMLGMLAVLGAAAGARRRRAERN